MTAATEIFGSEKAADAALNDWDLLRRAILELERRDLARMKGDYRHQTFDHLFQNQATTDKTLGEVVDDYRLEYAKTKSVGEKRVGKIAAALDLIIRFFGRDTQISQISRANCRDFRDLLHQLPTNLRKRFPDNKLPLRDIASEAADRKLDLLARESQDVYFNALKRILQFAKSEGYIDRHPADDLYPLGEKSSSKDARHPFSIDQLNRIFNAPLYRGCKDDESGYAIAGTNVIRRTRFWIPLIGLFTGMRLNEICQLEIDDIRQTSAGVWFIAVNDDGSDKRLKTKHSKREIPIHPELLRISFLRYVDGRRASSSKLLFEVKRSGRGYHSERMTRWFNEGFLPKLNAKTEKTSFHSFRHCFRDALRNINAPPAVVQGLGGWEMEEGVSGNYGDGLAADKLVTWVKRIRYSALDLSHINP